MRILYIGDCYGRTPYLYLADEPLFKLTPIPASWHEMAYTLEDMIRHIRQYMPRTYKDHIGKYEIVLLSDTGFSLYKPNQLMWFKRGVIENGQGILMVGGYQSFGGKAPEPSWAGSSVEDVLPVLCLDANVWEIGDFLPVPVNPEHEYYTALPWQGVKGFGGMNIVKTKETAVEVLAPSSGPDGPLLIYWEVGEGSGIAHTPDLTSGWGAQFMLWEYYPDYVSNLMFLLGRLKVPQDLNLMHAVQMALQTYKQERALLISLAEFVDRFGASFMKIERRMAEIGLMKAEADRLYSEQSYEPVLAKMDEISRSVAGLGEEAIRLKNRALMWVFLIEWLAVTATLMICGFMLWTLMVKRMLFREVKATRLDYRMGEDF